MKNLIITILCIGCLFGIANAQIDTISYHIYQKGGALGIGEPPSTLFGGIHLTSLNPVVRFTDTDVQAGDTYQIINNTKGNNVLNFAVYNKSDERAELSFSGDGSVVFPAGFTGFGVLKPKAKVQVANGDVYISSINHGIIMKSPDGNCWRGTVDNDGKLNFVLMDECPDNTTVSIDAPTNASNAKVSIYPNPAKENITVEVNNDNNVALNLSLCDHLGRELESLHLNKKKTTIGISHLSVGVYYIKIKGENFYMSEKLMKH